MEFEEKKWTALTTDDQDVALRFTPPTFDQTMSEDFRKCVVDMKAAKETSEFDLGKI